MDTSCIHIAYMVQKAMILHVRQKPIEASSSHEFL